MSAWIAANSSLLLLLFVLLHGLMQALHGVYPQNKVFAVWSALMPLDLVKTVKSIGAELAVPGAGIFLALAIPGLCLLAGGCHAVPPPETPALELAQQNAKIADTALGLCLATTSAADKLKGENGGQIVMSDLETCGADMLAAVRASWALHQAQMATLANLQADAGGQ